jgi:hypothetical protein
MLLQASPVNCTLPPGVLARFMVNDTLAASCAFIGSSGCEALIEVLSGPTHRLSVSLSVLLYATAQGGSSIARRSSATHFRILLAPCAALGRVRGGGIHESLSAMNASAWGPFAGKWCFFAPHVAVLPSLTPEHLRLCTADQAH